MVELMPPASSRRITVRRARLRCARLAPPYVVLGRRALRLRTLAACARRGGATPGRLHLRYAQNHDTCIRVIKRKSHNLDEALLKPAKRVLGVSTDTDAIHEALRAVLIGELTIADLRAATGRGTFRADFVRQMKRELRSR